jgi:hypothetical protein
MTAQTAGAVSRPAGRLAALPINDLTNHQKNPSRFRIASLGFIAALAQCHPYQWRAQGLSDLGRHQVAEQMKGLD